MASSSSQVGSPFGKAPLILPQIQMDGAKLLSLPPRFRVLIAGFFKLMQDSHQVERPTNHEGLPMTFKLKHGSILSRSILVTASNELFILFSRYTRGEDERLGQGEFKKHSMALNLQTLRGFSYVSARRHSQEDDAGKNYKEFEILSDVMKAAIPGSFFSQASAKGVWKDRWLEKLEDGDLIEALEECPSYFEDPENRIDIAFQLLEQHAFVNQHQILHLDVKPDNLLYSLQEDRLILRLSDFGLASRIGEPLMEVRGSPVYLSPESIVEYCKQKQYTIKHGEAPKTPCQSLGIKHEGWMTGMTLLASLGSFLDPKFFEQNPMLIKYIDLLNRDFDSQLKQLANIWYFRNTPMTQDKWMKEPADRKSVEFLIFMLTRLDPEARWSPEQARDAMNETFFAPEPVEALTASSETISLETSPQQEERANDPSAAVEIA